MAAGLQHPLTGGSFASNDALAANQAGNYAEGERLYLQSLESKRRLPDGENDIGYAIGLQGLSESQIHLGKLDEAEENLLKAQRIREAAEARRITMYDAAVTRDTLGQVHEIRGDLTKAREVRTKNPNNVACSHYKCPRISGQKLEDLQRCGRCKATFYCNPTCQKGDWKRHKPYCKVPDSEVEA